MTKVLVISDTHINPRNVKESEELWQKLAVYCAETKPEVIVHLGDVGDFDSQSWLIKNRGIYSLQEEIAAVNSCLKAFENTITAFNNYQRKCHHTLYRPEKVLTLGNHDVRNNITDVSDLFEGYGWTVVEYLEPVQVGDISFVHSASKGLSDNMCTTAQELVENWHGSLVVGHGHHKDYFESFSLPLNRVVFGMRCPAFMYQASNWAKQTRKKWSLGFTEIDTATSSFVWKDISCLYQIL